MALILALDTSTEACSCAVYDNGELSGDFALIPRQHAQSILPMINRLLTEKGLALAEFDALAYGRGPGSFTGLRIAAGVTQGLASACDLPVIAISTLQAMAWQARGKFGYSKVLSCLDARIDEVYWASICVDDEGIGRSSRDYLARPEEISESVLDEYFAGEQFYVVGNGLNYLQRFPEHVTNGICGQQPDIYPDAADIAWLAAREWQAGNTIAADAVQPVYLRDKVTHQ